jgi:hypothetical protein
VALALYPADWPFAIFKVLTGEHLKAHSKHNCRHWDVDQQYPGVFQLLFLPFSGFTGEEAANKEPP